MIKDVRLSIQVTRDIQRGRIPVRIGIKLQGWVNDVERRGLEEVRKTSGYHDEPLSGDRRGQRSIRLNRQWRAIYEVRETGALHVWVEEVTPHKY